MDLFDEIFPFLIEVSSTSYEKRDLFRRLMVLEKSSFNDEDLIEKSIGFLKDLEYKIPSFKKSDYKNLLCKLYYEIATIKYDNGDYSESIEKLEDFINYNEYCTSDFKKKAREKIAMCNYYLGKKEFDDYSDYDSARDYLEKSLEYFTNSNISSYNKNLINNKLSATYEKLGEKEWNINYPSYMNTAIDFYKKAISKYSGTNYNLKKKYNNLNEYYYLDKAFNSSGNERKDYLYSSYTYCGQYSSNIQSLYNRQQGILSIINETNNINSRISNINNEINNLNYDISRQKDINNIKQRYIETMNTKISKIQDNITFLNGKINDDCDVIIEKTDDTIQSQNKISDKINENIDNSKKFFKELEKMREDKKKVIEEKRNSNSELKEKNNQYCIMLDQLEAALRNRL